MWMLKKKCSDDKSALLALIDSTLELQRRLMDATEKIRQQDLLLKLQDEALRLPHTVRLSHEQIDDLARLLCDKISLLIENEPETVN